MSHTPRLSVVLALAMLAVACGEPPAAPKTPQPPAAPAAPQAPETPAAMPAEPPKPEGPLLALDGEGIRLVRPNGSTALLPFGRPTAEAVAALSTALGAPVDRGTNAECGAGPTEIVRWGGGFSAMFLEGKFNGWSADRRKGLTTMNGIGVGSTRAELFASYGDASVEDSTLGTEFSAGGLGGLLSGTGATARIETLWAGDICAFR
ncbi:MAG: hypothetical protein KF842_09805 [Caulobacter sp.]|nr:hypothetical protein [Caulobacter sp.]